MIEREFSSVVERIRVLCNVSLRVLDEVAGYPVYAVETEPHGQEERPSVYINAGTHGDEPAGVEAALTFLESAVDRWSRHFRVVVVPCLCPYAWVRNQRHNAQDVDINRAFLREDVAEIACVKRVIENSPFRTVIDLHEDWESPGCYLYEQCRGMSIGRLLTDRVRDVCLVDDRDRIEGEDAVAGVIHPNMNAPKRRDGSGIPIALFRNGHTDSMITAESPSGLALGVRVEAHLALIEEALTCHAEVVSHNAALRHDA